MIRRDSSPVGWMLLVDELEEANGHLTNLINEFNTNPVFDEIDSLTQLGHIYSHLNRAWNRRNREADFYLAMCGKKPVNFRQMWI